MVSLSEASEYTLGFVEECIGTAMVGTGTGLLAFGGLTGDLLLVPIGAAGIAEGARTWRRGFRHIENSVKIAAQQKTADPHKTI